MNAFQDLICRMKVAQNDLQTLHHYVRGGGGAWMPAHEKLGELYDSVAAMTDDLVETGMSLGITEPGIAEAVGQHPPEVQAVDIDTAGALRKAGAILWNIAGAMQAIGDQMGDDERYIQSKLDDYIYTLRKEAGYKLARAAE